MTGHPITNDTRTALLAGLGFSVAMGATAFLLPAGLDELLRPTGTSSAVTAFVREHQSAMLASRLLEGVAGLALLVFVGGLFARTRRADGSVNPFALTAVLGAVLTIAASFGKLAVGVAFVRLAESGVSLELLRGTHELERAFMNFLALAQGLFWASASVTLLREQVGPRWLAVLGLVGSALLFVSTVQILDPSHPLGIAGALVFPLFATWMLSAPIVLSRRPASRGEAPLTSHA
jgi:hypothetical protein